MNEYLSFRKMVTPMVIQVLFWIGVAICAIAGIVNIARGIGAEVGGGVMVLVGLLMLFLGPLAVRIYCEMLIVIFRLLDTASDILAEIRQKGASTPT